jgi:YD repeat-containing protein
VGQTCFTPPFFVEWRRKMGIRDWDIVTSYVDSVTTSLKTVTFPKVQEQVKVKNQGNANLTYTIGSQSGTLTPGQSITVNEDISSFSIQAVSGTHTFELRAKEKGTDQSVLETDSYNYNADGSVQSVTTTDNKNNVIKTVTYIYNASGDVTSSVTVANNETITTTYNYDVNGNITSTTNVIS